MKYNKEFLQRFIDFDNYSELETKIIDKEIEKMINYLITEQSQVSTEAVNELDKDQTVAEIFKDLTRIIANKYIDRIKKMNFKEILTEDDYNKFINGFKYNMINAGETGVIKSIIKNANKGAEDNGFYN